MLILKTRHKKVFFEKIYLTNIEHDATTSKIPFFSRLPRECMIRYFFENFFQVCKAKYQYRQKCILKFAISSCNV